VVEIAAAVNGVSEAIGEARLVVLGRGSEEAAPGLRARLRNPGTSLCVSGVVAADQISSRLAQADAFLFVRGALSNRRGSAVAAIAHGLPVAGYRGEETGPPLTDAGVVLVAPHDTAALSKAMVRMVSDSAWREGLQKRSRQAYERDFRWGRIAEKFEELLRSTA
jgi:glycosyltransferase involved in cell wall biosynthesis